MLVEDAINLLDEMLDNSWSLPLSGGRCVIDVERARELLDEIRVNLPKEFQEAEAVVIQKDKIVSSAKQEAEAIIRKAEERSRVILSQDESVKAAQKKASDIMNHSQAQAKEMRLASQKFSDNVLRQTEETLYRSLEEVKATRQALRGKKPGNTL